MTFKSVVRGNDIPVIPWKQLMLDRASFSFVYI